LNPSNHQDNKSFLCSIGRPEIWAAEDKLEKWVPPIGEANYLLAQYPLSVSPVLIVTKIEIELYIEVGSKKATPYIANLSPALEVEYQISPIISYENQDNRPNVTLKSGSIGYGTEITLPFAPRPCITGVIAEENNRGIWSIDSGRLWRIFHSSRIKGTYLLKAILVIPPKASKIIHRFKVRVSTQSWTNMKDIYDFNKEIIKFVPRKTQ